jgi:hypothetical protein
MTFHFGGHLFSNPLEVMFTSAVGFGEHHYLGVDQSQCPPRWIKSEIYSIIFFIWKEELN